ncbi:MSMB isoform 2 [Pan troglodytes]|uniref:Beta-microseminoprotein n=6 Tax=Homininae TaxID=207598 RepID=A0A6D2WQZ1_PANTR|nr:beta-microseminoprotein [Pan troglodytes]XP_057154855.1 beta-microseminoprotein isoform X1 [Pan paniscus]PNI11467.1 MSMB isoform 1 [Pan troglodytes]PNI11468.1 MSMB isoform 2 [Pan troglodytes]
MNVLLGSLVIFATFVTLCNASCYFIPNEGVPGDSTRKCMDLEGNKHPINSEWQTDNCETCTCYETEISCCTLVSTPVGYDKDNCQRIFKKEDCKYIVVEKKDPKKTCSVSEWII